MDSGMNGSASSSAHQEGDANISRPFYVRGVRPDPLRQINAGGIGLPPDFAVLPKRYEYRFEIQYLPGQPKSISGIALRSFLLGLVLSTSLISTICLLTITSSPLWRLPFFLATLAIFHFLEFFTTARYNTHSAQVSSFLLSQNGSAYNIAHSMAMVECLITNLAYRNWVSQSFTNILVIIGLLLIVVGQASRSMAMIQAGTNFNHVVQYQKANEHQLVTTGIFAFLRHPSYFGFFYWALGNMLVLGNFICFFGYLIVLWQFFSRRIAGEEELLVKFFGDEYIQYRQKTGVGIPFIR